MGVSISIVIPYYNPGKRVVSTVEGVLDVLGASGGSFEVIAVNDGSTDGSPTLVGAIDDGHLVRIDIPVRSGKGNAVTIGLRGARGDYLGFIDGDGDIPPSTIATMLEVIDQESPDLIIGSKRHPDSDVVYPLLRRIYSWGYQQLIRVLFNLNVKDTQVGTKLLRRDVADAILPSMTEKGFSFDLEMLVLARRAGFNRVAEVPVAIMQRFGSTVSIRSALAMLQQAFSIFWRVRTRKR